MLLGLVAAHVLLDLVADGTQFLLLSILAHLADNGLALLGVGVLLGLLGSGADLQLALLHGLVVAVLLLHGEGNLVGELLAPLVSTGLAQLLAHLPGGVVALLGWSLLASHGSLAVLGLVLAAVEVDGEDAGPVLDNLLLVPAVLVVNVHALEVVLGGDGQVVHGVTDAVRHLHRKITCIHFIEK